MNPQPDKSWETRLGCALKNLPELTAPAGLVERTMAALERRQKPVWYKQPWITWPLWLRVLSLTTMLAFLGAICVAKWEFAHTAWGAALAQRLNERFSDFGIIFSALDTLGRAAVTIARHVNGWVAALCLLTATTAYLACIGIGTAAARLTGLRR